MEIAKENLPETGKFDGITIVKSDEYGRYTDLLSVHLEPDRMYTHDEIKAIIEQELARPVVKEVNE